jgi:small-conductance mechanosensitive channel
MNSKSIYKVPNGKLLKINLEYNENTNYIEKVTITGDFFAYPEEAIDIIEEKLKNIQIKKNILFDMIQSIINEHEIEFIGLNAEGLTEGILMCLK